MSGSSLRARRAAAALAAVAIACASGCGTPDGDAVRTGTVSATRPAAPASTATPFRSTREYQRVALPLRLRIPSLGIDTRLTRVGLAADGTVAAPREWDAAAWFEGSPRPGQDGPAVIVGHVDSRSGPAVFYRLARLRPGDRILVDRADGSQVSFRVAGRWQVPKANFPTDLVYAPTLEPSLRLVTCGGVFDRSSGHYRDNVVVSAVPG